MLQKISLKLVQQKFRARKKHLVHPPIQLRFAIPFNDRLSCDSADMKEPPPSSAETHEKQSSASEKPATVGEKPCQPSDRKCFLDRGKNSRPFRPSWFDHDEWQTWLHYDQEKDAAFCFTCIKAVEQNLISSKNVGKAFISVGCKDWSDAATSGRGFDKHNG